MFSQTLRALDRDRGRVSLAALLLSGSLLVVWGVWFTFGRVTLYAVSPRARIEVSERPYTVRTPVEGAVETSRMVLGELVAKGETLVTLDSRVKRLQLEELGVNERGLVARIADVERELVSQERALVENRSAAAALEQTNEALVELADSRTRLSESEAQRLARIHAEGLISELELQRAAARAEQERASTSAARSRSLNLVHENRAEASEREARISELRARLTSLRAEIGLVRARRETLREELERHELKAPIAGRLADVVPVTAGGFLGRGDVVAAIVPEGDARIVAELDADEALGRVRPGQPARLRLDGFSWVQFGAVPARVDRVGSESRDGAVRVELAIPDPSSFPVPLAHGLPGTIEIEVESLSPLHLLMRSAGRWMTSQPGSASASLSQEARRR